MSTLLHAELTYALRGIGFRIYNALGPGHPEKDYDQAVQVALQSDGIDFESQPVFRIDYKDWQVGEYRPDFTFANNAVVVDLKVAPTIEPLHKGQVLSYVKVIGAELGMIMNFGGPSMEFERLPNFMDGRNFDQKVSPPEGILYPELTNQLIDLLLEVHSTLGPGFLHQIYRRATRRELDLRMINYDVIKELPLLFEGHQISMRETRLFHIEQKVLLATFALRKVEESHLQKLRWAMKQLNCRLGLIANFHPTHLEIRFARLK